MKSTNLFLGITALFLGVALAFLPILFMFGFAITCGILMLRFNYQIAVYVLAFYSIVDFAIRKVMPMLAGAWDDLFLVCLMFLVVYKWILFRNEKNFKWSPIDVPIFLYIAINFLCIFMKPYEMDIVIEGFRANVEFLLFFFVFFQLIKGIKSVKVIYNCLIISIFFVSLYGVYQYATGVQMPAGWVDSAESGIKTRAFSIIGSPNILGSIIALVSPLTLSLIILEKKVFVKLIYIGMYLTMVLCLLVTYSRGAWFVFMGGIFVYILLKDARFIIPAILGVVLILVFVPSVGDRLSYMFSREYIQSSLRGGRLVRWGTGIEAIKTSPFFGVGLGHIGGAVATNNEVSGHFYMDNYYLKIASEIGLVGILFLFNLMYKTLKWCYLGILKVKDKPSKELMISGFAGIIAIVFNNFVENIFEVPLMVITFWLVVACVLSLWYENEDSYANE